MSSDDASRANHPSARPVGDRMIISTTHFNEIAHFFYMNFIRDECQFADPLPSVLRLPLAMEMGNDERGWPDVTITERLAYLDENYRWTP